MVFELQSEVAIGSGGDTMQSPAVSEHSALYALLCHFAHRQQLVHSAVEELRPDLLMLSELDGSPTAKSNYDALRNRFQDTPVSGHWGPDGEWIYINQGLGMQLIHIKTGETLEWGYSNWWRIKPDHFIQYVLWLIETNAVIAPLETIRQALQRYPQINRVSLRMYITFLLDKLVEIGAIERSPCGIRYELRGV